MVYSIRTGLDETEDLLVGIYVRSRIYLRTDEDLLDGIALENCTRAFKFCNGNFLVPRVCKPIGVDNWVNTGIAGNDSHITTGK